MTRSDEPERPAPGDGVIDEATTLSIRRRAAQDPADIGDVTTVSTRRRALDQAPVAASGPRAVPEPPDDVTAPSSRAASRADAAAELEGTLLRPRRLPSSGAPTLPQPVATVPARPPRDAHVPDAAALRVPVAPRAVPPAVADRATPRPRAPAQARPAEDGDHASGERAVRVRDRRRVLVVVLSATVVAVGSAGALVLLLLT